MQEPSPRQSNINSLLPSIRKLLATSTQYTIEPASGPKRGIDYSRGRFAIGYLAHAERIDGRIRATTPHSLEVRFDGEMVLGLRWKDGRRRSIVYKPGRWENELKRWARGSVDCGEN